MNPNVKLRCVVRDCKAVLEYSEVRYERQGNYCNKCSAKCNQNAMRRRETNMKLFFPMDRNSTETSI